MSSDKFHCTNGHCLSDCALSSSDYDKDFPPGFCPHSGVAVCWQKCETTEKKPTVFNRITASPEVLAEKLVYGVETIVPLYQHVVTRWYSNIIHDIIFDSKPEAIAATVAKLKEVGE